MMKFASFIFAALFASAAFAAFAVENDVPLPPPSGPGQTQPTPIPPPPEPPDQPPTDPSQPPEQPRPPQQPGREVDYTLGSVQTTRFVAHDYVLYPTQGLQQIHMLRLTGLSNKVNIRSVVVSYANGNQEEVYDLSGTLELGQTREAYLSGAAIVSIVVRASNSAFWRKPGAFRVDASATSGP